MFDRVIHYIKKRYIKLCLTYTPLFVIHAMIVLPIQQIKAFLRH